MSFEIIKYDNSKEFIWDEFVLNESINGTFLQTRKFLNYHKNDKFKDCSLGIFNGNELVAVVPACEILDDGRVFFSHKGSTFGGIVVSPKIYNTTKVDELMDLLNSFLLQNGFERAFFKQTTTIYQKENTDLLDYYFYKNGYQCYDELNYYLNLEHYREDVIGNFSASKRRDYRYSLKNGLVFKQLESKEEVAQFYGVLLKNLEKLQLTPVHSLEDLYDLKFNRFYDTIKFYGVFYEEKMIAGSMVFIISDHVFHTQYLSSDEAYLKLYPMVFLITNLIITAGKMNMKLFSFGICTENQGKYLNLGLSRFKEGFGTKYCINRSYEKLLN